jgi:DNA-binding response OmpR family regulator
MHYTQPKPFILLVEDDDYLRKVIATNLDARGYMTLEADSFSQAVEQLSIKPQLIILDIGLPDATGWDVASWAETVSVSAPMIVISASEPDNKQMERFKPMSFLGKPFNIGQLMKLVEMYTRRVPHWFR